MERKDQIDNAVELSDLVYAPLGAVADANIRLSANFVEFLASTGDLKKDSSGKPMVHLRTIQLMYNQLRSDALDNTVSDSIGVEIPLLSVYPLSSLKISKTKVAFDVEIKGTRMSEDGTKIYTRVSSRKAKGSIGQPRISYEVELESVPAAEGFARFIDTLNAHAIPKRFHSSPLDDSGRKLVGQKLEEYEHKISLIKREAELRDKIAAIKEVIRTKNNSLNMKTGMNFEEYRDHRKLLGDTNEKDHPPEVYTEIKQFHTVCDKLEQQLAEVRLEIVINKVSDKDDE